MGQFPSPTLYAVLILAWLLLSGAVIYRYLYSGWTQARTALMLGMAGGWIGYSIVEANALFGFPRIVVDTIFVLSGLTFIIGSGYALYVHLRTDSTAARNA
jgi:hypothetical protein